MRLISFASMFALAVSTAAVDAASPPSHSAIPTPITTRQTLFSIPFQIERADHDARRAVEVQLYVSTDRGAHWQVYDRVPPENRHFLFRAVTDGEYWFLIRTLDRSGQLRPQRADGPGLRVVVDTTLPKFELQAQQGKAGEIVVRWQVVEPYLDVNSLKVQYRTGPSLPWQSVAIDRQSINPAGETRKGEVIWWPNAPGELVEIRAEVADTAGNSAVSHAKVDLDRLASAGSRPAADPRQDNPVPTDVAGATPPSTATWRPSVGAAPATSSWPTDPPTAASPPEQPIAARYGPPRDPSVGRYGRSEPAESAAATPGVGDSTAWPPPSSVAANPNPVVGSRYGEPRQSAVDTTGTPTAPDNPPKMVNSRLFELDYQMDSVALSGVQRVELWGTRDGGLSWSNFGADRDKRSPMLVTVNEEGLYGFRVVVQDASLNDQKPQRGDRPDVWIGVDLTKPAARITSAQRGSGNQADRMIIEWEADDQMLTARPVSLSVSGSAGGPWMVIASGVENTGRYSWPVDDRLPRQLYLRLEVRDNAGNVGVFETAETGVSDPLRPTAGTQDVRPTVRIQDVRPLVESGRTRRWE
ncbi:MAG: hypothetical protein HQ582_13375 [Planctomycetes bacterium]|nr:hypothetical protein [Planctomycetota bacterium]